MKPIEIDSDLKPDYLDAVEDHNFFFLIRLKGCLETKAIERGHAKMTEVIERAKLYTKSVVCDFGGVTDSDTATLAALIQRFAEFKKRGGGRVAFFNVRDELRSLFEISHLMKFFTVCENEMDAKTVILFGQSAA